MHEDDTELVTTDRGQDQVEASGPEGGGTRSNSFAGGNKRDPVQSAPTIGRTIAGRDVTTAAEHGEGNAGVELADLRIDTATNDTEVAQRERPDLGDTIEHDVDR